MAILPKVKLKALVAFPADVEVENPLTLVKDGLTYRFGLDPSLGAIGPTGPGYGGTSNTSLVIGTGSKSFTTQSGYAYQPGNYIRASSAADGTNYMEGNITSYVGETLVISVTKTGGSGTKADWTFSLAGTPGATGSGSGDMLAANNLSDVANKKTAKDNISIHGVDVASASTINLDAATGDLVDLTGTTTVNAITLSEGRERTVRFAGALTLAHGASLVLPGSANIVTVAGDFAVFRGYAAGIVRCVGYEPVSGGALLVNTKGADIASASTVNLNAATGDCVDLTGTTTINAITLAEGRERTVRFTGILTLTHGASLVLPGGTSIVTAADDFVKFRGYAGGVVRCVSYQMANDAEEVASTVAFGAGISLTSGSGGQVWTTVAIPRAGLWEINGNVGVSRIGPSTPVFTHMHADHNMIGQTTIQTAPANGTTIAMHITSNDPNGWLVAYPSKRYRTTAAATVTFVMTADFSSTASAYGSVSARRVAP